MPSSWRIPRPRGLRENEDGVRALDIAEGEPPAPDRIERAEDGAWHVVLAWSEEALAEAAYEMTFHYMAEVGERVFSIGGVPPGLEHMTPAEAGYNVIKERLYHFIRAQRAPRHERLATRLYNVYCFGYALAADSREMLWPEDVQGA
jgi:hypothetical protein